jgi:hypothetical protein
MDEEKKTDGSAMSSISSLGQWCMEQQRRATGSDLLSLLAALIVLHEEGQESSQKALVSLVALDESGCIG